MRFTLSSRGRLVGHTALDIHTVTSTMRQGFIEPTEEGRQILANATGVWRTMAELKRGGRRRGGPGRNDNELFLAAVQRRESLDLELRDEHGVVFDCSFMRVTDLFDLNNGIADEMCDTEEEEEAAFQIRLSSLSDEDRDEALAQRAASDAEAEAMVAEISDERDEEQMFGSSWPAPPPDDPRWETKQYLLQAYLTNEAWERPEL